MLRNRYVFQETRLTSDSVHVERAKREVYSASEAGARARLPKPRPGRKWRLLEVVRPQNVPTRMVPVYLEGDQTRAIGVADVRADGLVDIHIEDGLRVLSSTNIHEKAKRVSLSWSLESDI